jgi:WD40 repeat protein
LNSLLATTPGLALFLWLAVGRVIEFSPDGRSLALTGIVKTGVSVFLFKFEQVLASLEAKRVPRLPPEAGMDFAFGPDGTRLALAGVGLRIWDIRSGALVAYPKP